jgi:hypothetical protein
MCARKEEEGVEIKRSEDNKGVWYRLKGCGNLDQGFPLGEVQFPQGATEIRGAHYMYTLATEFYYTTLVNNILQNAEPPLQVFILY